MKLVCICWASICLISSSAAQEGLSFTADADRLHIRHGGIKLCSYLMKSEIIKRPGFINVHTARGAVVTRPFPVQEDPKSGGDHPDMHPGIWFGFGDLNGTDFWRNKGLVEHVRFTLPPKVEDGALTFAVLNRYSAADGVEVCQQTMRAVVRLHDQGWQLTLETELWNDAGELSLGAQEEMGLGVRMSGALNEKAGGLVTNSLGDRGAKSAWGKVAEWWDYSGPDGKAGVLVAPTPENSLKCWGHTRDYGVMVMNPTPREPAKNRIILPQGQRLKLGFEVLIHDTPTTFDARSAAALLAK